MYFRFFFSRFNDLVGNTIELFFPDNSLARLVFSFLFVSYLYRIRKRVELVSFQNKGYSIKPFIFFVLLSFNV